jgi:hypothetical protein
VLAAKRMSIRRHYIVIGASALAIVGSIIFWPDSHIYDRAAALPAGSSKAEVYSGLGKPCVLIPIHGPDHEYVREVWIYPGPLKLTPKVSFRPLQACLFERKAGPRIYFDAAGRVERVALSGGRTN